jgi:hypothetical protein
LRALTHRLDRVHHILLMIDVGVSERRRPRQVLVHVRKDRWKLRERLDARIPGLRVDLLRELLWVVPAALLHPTLRLDDLLGIRGGREDLGDQLVRIQGNRGHELLQLCRRRFCRLYVEWRGGLVRRVGEAHRHGAWHEGEYQQ